MISHEEAREYVLRDLRPLAPRDVELKDALGLVTAKTVHAREPSPRWTASPFGRGHYGRTSSSRDRGHDLGR